MTVDSCSLLDLGDIQANQDFATKIGSILIFLDEEEVHREWWERWMTDYWKNRI